MGPAAMEPVAMGPVTMAATVAAVHKGQRLAVAGRTHWQHQEKFGPIIPPALGHMWFRGAAVGWHFVDRRVDLVVKHDC